MKLKLFLPVLLIAVMMGCSPKSTPTEAPATNTNTRVPPTSTPTPMPPTASQTPRPSPITAPSPTEIVPGAVLFEEDFEDGIADNLVYSWGGWRASSEDNGNKVYEVNTNTEASIQYNRPASLGFGSKEWTNYSAEYRVKMLNAKANTWLSFRSDIGANRDHYVEWLSAEYDGISLHINLNGSGWNLLKDLSLPVWDERWYQVRVEAQGSTLRVYLDDNLMLQTEDTSIASGVLELGVFPGTHALFDDIRVVALGDSP